MPTYSVALRPPRKEEPYRGEPFPGLSAIVTISPPIVIGEAFSQVTGLPSHHAVTKIRHLFSDATTTYLQVTMRGRHVDENALTELRKRIANALTNPDLFAEYDTKSLQH